VYDARRNRVRTQEDLMRILSWIIFGLVAGVIAKLLMPGRDPGGCIITMLLGIAGAFVGGFVFEQLTGRPDVIRFDLGSPRRGGRRSDCRAPDLPPDSRSEDLRSWPQGPIP
jgi:uncharacterized membrane protein YeaQ/YmgE (transglycosylase-associated protein family)